MICAQRGSCRPHIWPNWSVSYGYAECLHRAPEMAPLGAYPPFDQLLQPKG